MGGSLLIAVVAWAAAVTAPATAVFCPISFCGDRIDLDVRDVRVFPSALPDGTRAPVAFGGKARISVASGGHPSALREVLLAVDKSVKVDVGDVPVCRGGGRDVRRTLRQIEKECGEAVVGRGKASFSISFPSFPSTPESSKVVLFNGEARGRATMLFYAVAQVKVPVPQLVVAEIRVKRVKKGRYGWQATVKVPVIAGGSGSLTGVSLRLHRLFGRTAKKSFLSAGCRDGRLQLKILNALFRNEVKAPGVASQTALKGTTTIPCTSSG